MKNLIIVLYSVLAFALNARGAQITGKGFSPYIENESSLSRMLATWDAISDALVKTQGTLNGSLSLENELIKSHRITYQNDFNRLKLIERSCDINSTQVTCLVIIDVQNSQIQQPTPNFELKECSSYGEGVEFCYESEARNFKESSFGLSTEVQTRVQIRWKLYGNTQVLFAETLISTGLGKTKEGSFQSGILQAQSKIRKQKNKWNQIRSSFQDLQLLAMGRGISKKLEVYLKLMGAHTFELNGKRYILLPSIITKS